MKETDVVASEFVEAEEAAPEVLELADKALDKAPLLVKLGVILGRAFAIGLRWNDRFCTYVSDGASNVFSVINCPRRRISVRLMVSSLISFTILSSTSLSASSRMVQLSRSSGWLQASATKSASCLPSSFGAAPERGLS